MDFSNLIDEFQTHLIKQGKQKSTVESYVRDAKGFLNFTTKVNLAINAIEPQTLVSYQAFLQKSGKINSIRRTLIGVRQFFRFYAKKNKLKSNPLEEVPIPSRSEQLHPVLKTDEVSKILGFTETGPCLVKSWRDGSIIALLAYEGIKVSELIELTWSDFILNKELGSLRVVGNRARIIQLRPDTARRIHTYQKHLLAHFPKNLYTHLHTYMFIAYKGRDLSKPEPQITRHGLKFMIYDLGNSINKPKINSEMLRHHAIGYHLLLGRTPEEIMQHFGLKRAGNIGKHAQLIQQKLPIFCP